MDISVPWILVFTMLTWVSWCVTALFFKNSDKIDNFCRLALSNITGLQANYLDQCLWVISVEEPVQMEVKCEDHNHVKT